METKATPYSVVWQQVSPGSQIGSSFGVPDYDGFLPFFVLESQTDRRKGMSFEINEEKLLFGICYGLHGYFYGHLRYPDLTEHDIVTYKALFASLAQGFRLPNPEEAFLTISNHLRKVTSDSWVAIAILETGIKFLDGHHNTALRSNLCLDYWRVIESVIEAGQRAMLIGTVLGILEELKAELNDQNANQILGYVAVTLAQSVGQGERAARFWQKYGRFVTDQGLRDASEHNMRHPTRLRWIDLGLGSQSAAVM